MIKFQIINSPTSTESRFLLPIGEKKKMRGIVCYSASTPSPLPSPLLGEGRCLALQQIIGICALFVICNLEFGILTKICFAADKKEEPIVCNGDKIEYIEGNKKLIGSGNINIVYEDVKLTADTVEVQLDAKEAYASGNVVLTQGKSVFKADNILYNFQEKTGRLINGAMAAPPWYGKCDQIDKVSEKEYVLGTGYISTCDRVPPHYKIRTKQVRLYLDDRIEAKNVVICAGSVPIMYLPIYTQKVKNKKPMVAFVPGHSKEWGYYNLAAFRYNLSETQQGKIHLDIRSKKGFASGITHNYTGLGNGIFGVYYMNENDKNKPQDTQRERERYRIMLRHKWQMDSKTLALAEYNKLKDQDFIKDYFYKQEYVNEIQPKTYLSLLRSEEGYNASFLFQNRINSFFTETEYTPQLAIDIKNQRLFEKAPIYYKGDYSVANLAKKEANSNSDDDAGRLDGYNELSYVFSPFGSLCFNPYVGTRQTWYSKDRYGSENEYRGLFYSGIDASTRFYKTYDLEGKFFRTQIHGLRHVAAPVIRYSYIHKPTLSTNRLADFDDLDAIDRKNAVTFALENDFLTKKIINEKDEISQGPYDTIDLARFIISTDYNLDKNPGGEFTNVIGDLELSPSNNFLLELDTSFNPHSQKFDIANIDFVAKKDDATRIGIGHRYQRRESSEMTLDGRYPLTKKINLHAYERYQFYGNDFKEQEYGISYDLHCWTMDLTLNHGDSSTIWVIFRLKAFPDFPIQLGSTYESPKPQTEAVGD
jgi:lipopolysaccharide assembly outer membrane protein LptD (OstA)